MKDVKIKLYTFDELSREAKDDVIERERKEQYGFCFWGIQNNGDEMQDTLKAFASAFDVKYKIVDDHGRPFITFTVDVNDEDESGKYLFRYLNNHYFAALSRRYYWKNGKSRKSRIMYEAGQCPLTGICWDCDILQPIFDWFKAPDWNLSIHDLIDSCFSSLLNVWDEQDEYCLTDEYIEEMILNNWEDKLFYEDGTEYDGPDVDKLKDVA